MTAVETITNPATTGISEDNLSHRFCKSQAAVRETEQATARCGKTKTGWVRADAADLGCMVCYEMFRAEQCAHCNQQTKGTT